MNTDNLNQNKEASKRSNQSQASESTIDPLWLFPIGGAIASLRIFGRVTPEDIDALIEVATLIKKQRRSERRAESPFAPLIG